MTTTPLTHTESFAAFRAKKDQARDEQASQDKAALDKRDTRRNGPRREAEARNGTDQREEASEYATQTGSNGLIIVFRRSTGVAEFKTYDSGKVNRFFRAERAARRAA